jgi:hypothetical protein
MIWVFALAAVTPWWVIVLFRAHRPFKDMDGWTLFLTLWCVAGLAFFTFSANIIWPYALAVIPGFALLFTELALWSDKKVIQAVPTLALVTAVAGLAVTVLVTVAPDDFIRNEKQAVTSWQKTSPVPKSQLVYWAKDLDFTAAFYSKGRARAVHDVSGLYALTGNKTRDCVVTFAPAEKVFPPDLQPAFTRVGLLKKGRHLQYLFCES